MQCSQDIARDDVIVGTGRNLTPVRSVLQVIRGGALGCVFAGCLLAIALLLGLAPGANRLVYVAVAVAGLVFWMIPQERSGPNLVGAGLVASMGIVGGALTGYGVLEIVLVAGGALAAVVSLRGMPLFAMKPGLSAVVSVVVVLVALVPLIVDGGTLGHDESAYALKARHWLEGTPETGWSLHRAPALSAFGYVVLAAGGEETMLRTIGLLSLGGIAAATWWLGSMVSNRIVGSIAAVAVVAGSATLRRATEYLTDLPSAALLVCCMAVLWFEFERREGGPTYSLLWVLPFAWAAFYLRYQSALAFLLIGLMMMIVWWRPIRRQPGPLVVTALVGLAGMIPHALMAMTETGSPIGIILVTGEAAGREFVGEGLVDYILLLGWPLIGLLGLPLVVFFWWWLWAGWSDPVQRKVGLFLGIPAVGQVLVLGLVSHGEPRFVFFPLALVVIGATAGALVISEGWSERLRRGIRAALVLLLIGSVALAVAATRGSVENRALSNEPLELAGDRIETETRGASCGVLTSYAPQITFYSECSTDVFRSATAPGDAVARLEGDEKFMLLVENGKRQPGGDFLRGLMAETQGEPIPIDGERDSAVLFELVDS